jgi:hypothetical protein
MEAQKLHAARPAEYPADLAIMDGVTRPTDDYEHPFNPASLPQPSPRTPAFGRRPVQVMLLLLPPPWGSKTRRASNTCIWHARVQ